MRDGVIDQLKERFFTTDGYEDERERYRVSILDEAASDII